MATEYRFLRLASEPPLAIVQLDRPRQRNALSIALRDELEACLGALDADDAVRVVILWGGPECFSAGFDLKEVLATDFAAFAHRAVEFTERTCFFAKPLVTAVAGPALAGGFDLAISGDVIVAAESAVLGRPEVRFGINPLLAKLAQRLGMARALRLSLTGEILPAPRALGLGLVDRVVPAEALLAAAREEAGAMAANPLPALLAVKRAARALPGLGPRQAIEHEFRLTQELLADTRTRAALREYARGLGITGG
jgi:enoyl-CoA hydratase